VKRGANLAAFLSQQNNLPRFIFGSLAVIRYGKGFRSINTLAGIAVTCLK
jgi:hypothetical protein